MNSKSFDRYEAELADHRDAFAANAGVTLLTSPECHERLFSHWLLRYCVHGVAMTASVDSWIAGAGDRCLQLGHQALGKALKAHARAEAGHDQMMIADAHAIAAKLYQDFAIPIDVGNLLASPPLASAQAYAALHERVISGHTPQAQLAIEYEIEQLSITIGPPVVKKCREVFGSDTRFYSFLAEHVELDAGHTAFNRKQLQYLLSESPEALASMTDAGRAALSLYTDFVAECLRLAHADLRTGDPA